MAGSDIPERFLHTIWNDREHFLRPELKLIDGTSAVILNGGEWNAHRGGPDFLNAQVAIESTVVTGDIEIHKRSSDWSSHEHHRDPRYNRVILHVLLEAEDITAAPEIPTLSIRENLSVSREDLWRTLFERFYDRAPELPCFPHNMLVPMKWKRKIVEHMGEARLDELIGRFSARGQGERRQQVYLAVMDALGYAQNREPFKELAKVLTLDLLKQISSNSTPERRPAMFEALFLGVAGLLPEPSSEYDPRSNEYIVESQSLWHEIQGGYELPYVLAHSDWAFFRIRPLNSPYRRVALAASLVEQLFLRTDDLWSVVESSLTPSLGRSAFWESHTSYAKPLAEPQSLLGLERAEALLLNVFIPARLAELQHAGESRELRLLWKERRSTSSATYLKMISQELLEGERLWTVVEEQGALYLSRNYCEKLRCQECPIGRKIVEKGGPSVMASRRGA